MSKCSSDNSNTEISNIKTVNPWFIYHTWKEEESLFVCFTKLFLRKYYVEAIQWPHQFRGCKLFVQKLKLCHRGAITRHCLLALRKQLINNQFICETTERLLTSRDSELFLKTSLRGKKNLLKHTKESKNWQNYRLLCFHIIGLPVEVFHLGFAFPK